MLDLQIHTEEAPPPAQVPLLTSIISNQNNHETVSNTISHNHHDNDDTATKTETETELDRTLARVETFLTLLGFNQSSIFTFLLSWTVFASVGVALPLIALRFTKCNYSTFNCEKIGIESFEIDIVAFQAILAAVSLLCLSHNLRKYGLRRFLFVDCHSGKMAYFHDDYVKQIKESMHLLFWWVLLCFFLKTVSEIIRIPYAQHGSWPLSLAPTLALIISWTYVSAISLSASVLFHLVCKLQVVHFDDYGKLLQRESDVLVFMEEHIQLCYHLSKISHRFRIYLLLGFLVVTASQCVTLLQVTGHSGSINFINGGDFTGSTIVQVVGLIICVHAAARISHRAEGVVSVVSMWDALLTCNSSDPSQLRSSANLESLEAANLLNSIRQDYSETDLESMDFAGSGMPTNTLMVSCMSPHHRRQALVMYLQTNPGGITIFGWKINRTLINVIFLVELSLVTFILGKTLI